jgi:hypothetical protein
MNNIRFWYVDRIGRLTSGIAILGFSVMAILVDPAWLWAVAAIGIHLTLASIINLCPFHWLYVRMGAVEREDVYLPGGIPRASPQSTSNNREFQQSTVGSERQH